MTSDDYTKLRYAVADGVATITLNRPERLNAIDHGPGSLEEELVSALERSDRDDAVGCNVVTGAGTVFSSGGDIGAREPRETAVEWHRFLRMTDAANERIRGVEKPVIGAINGICYGAAFNLITHFDLLVAVDHARFGLIETRFGSTGADILTFLVGPQWAKFLTLTGEVITASKAQEIGLVLAVYPEDRFQAKVDDLARRIASMPRDAVVLNRRVVNATVSTLGWSIQKEAALALNAITNSVTSRAAGVDGRVFVDVLRDEGWTAFKELRDRPFKSPWLEDERDAGAQ